MPLVERIYLTIETTTFYNASRIEGEIIAVIKKKTKIVAGAALRIAWPQLWRDIG